MMEGQIRLSEVTCRLFKYTKTQTREEEQQFFFCQRMTFHRVENGKDRKRSWPVFDLIFPRIQGDDDDHKKIRKPQYLSSTITGNNR